MNNYSKYGDKDIQLILVHGGPGARGSLQNLALMLSHEMGILEIQQTEYTIDGLIEEMKRYFDMHCKQPVVLLGHSWGAWLVCLYAARYPEMIKKLILVGSGPFDEAYVKGCNETRMSRLSKAERPYFEELMKKLQSEDLFIKDEVMKAFGALMGKLDTYEVLENEKSSVGQGDFKMYNAIWPEAAAMRKSGNLLAEAKHLTVPLHIIQGEYDSHNIKGILEPFDQFEIPYTYDHLCKCGHYPWREKYAQKSFLEIIKHMVAES